RRGDVVERCGDHWAPPSVSGVSWLGAAASKCGWASPAEPTWRSAPPDWTARHTRSGVHGIGTSSTPRWRTASTIALTTAGVEAMVPASPTPLVPRVFVVEGETVWSVTKLIVSAAVGSV